ncbi:hypothetical protein [Effusibacillus pohliae]|uniref:hypothetical protein n=1 Tax=Effusibacillus pohliae TaxID=232270 RepID=UPI0012EA546C|nr:hypothetical protein [Effusibacillus pohliae]
MANRQVLAHLQNSLYALEVQCSLSTQMELNPETKALPGLRDVDKHNYESSYHRTTAIGCLRRILAGERHPDVMGIMIRCMLEAEEHDVETGRAMDRMLRSATTRTAEQWVRTAKRWQEQQLVHLREAIVLARSLVGESMWEYAKKLEY